MQPPFTTGEDHAGWAIQSAMIAIGENPNTPLIPITDADGTLVAFCPKPHAEEVTERLNHAGDHA